MSNFTPLAIAPVAIGSAIALCVFVFCSVIAAQMIINFFKWFNTPEKEDRGPKASPEQTANNDANGMRRHHHADNHL